MLYLFTDNFDYQHIRQDFIRGLLSDEIMGNKIYMHEIEGTDYAARVHNLRSYDAVSQDIVQRWVYPLVPDANLLCGTSGAGSYRHFRNNIYKETNVSLCRSAVIGADTALGTGTVIGERTLVNR